MMNLVILGAKESGTGAALLGKKLKYNVFLSDKGRIEEKYKAVLAAENIPFEEERHTEEKIMSADMVVKSPGIPDTAPMIVALRAKGIEVISEIEFAGRHSHAHMVCITGSNGKTTTTLLTHHILTTAGVDAGLAGNVGHSLAAQVAEGAHPIYVVELSSFQLDGMTTFKADVAVLTNITPDHLDRYGHKFENYAASKYRILQNMKKSELFIYGADCPVTSKMAAERRVDEQVTVAPFGLTERNAAHRSYMDGDVIVVVSGDRTFRIDKNEITIKGRHNLYNAMAAVSACMWLGVSDEAIARGLQTFPQVEHRLETAGVKYGVTYINDSKATNVDSAWYALDSMTTPVVWIVGGTDKGNDYSVLFDFVRNKVKAIICMGVDNKKLLDSFHGVCPVILDTHSLADAMQAAKSQAVAGDTVLLSPCCASFDLFKNYEDRGRLFKESVAKL